MRARVRYNECNNVYTSYEKNDFLTYLKPNYFKKQCIIIFTYMKYTGLKLHFWPKIDGEKWSKAKLF